MTATIGTTHLTTQASSTPTNSTRSPKLKVTLRMSSVARIPLSKNAGMSRARTGP